MTKEAIEEFINENPITNFGVRVDFINKPFDVGFFEYFQDSDELAELNQWRFVRNNQSEAYQLTRSLKHTIVLHGDDITKLTIV